MDSGIVIKHDDHENQSEIEFFLAKHWGSKNIVSRGKIIDASRLPRIIARDKNGSLMGLATYSIDFDGKSCELVSIDAVVQNLGIGSKLLHAVEDETRKAGCKRLWFITLNDNPEAVAFYVKKGYRLVAVHLHAVDTSRKLKPQIPQIGKHGIALKDEWEFEKNL